MAVPKQIVARAPKISESSSINEISQTHLTKLKILSGKSYNDYVEKKDHNMKKWMMMRWKKEGYTT